MMGHRVTLCIVHSVCRTEGKLRRRITLKLSQLLHGHSMNWRSVDTRVFAREVPVPVPVVADLERKSLRYPILWPAVPPDFFTLQTARFIWIEVATHSHTADRRCPLPELIMYMQPTSLDCVLSPRLGQLPIYKARFCSCTGAARGSSWGECQSCYVDGSIVGRKNCGQEGTLDITLIMVE